MVNSESVLINLALLLLFISGCTEEKVPERFYPRNNHEAYWYSLKQANLLETALGQDWNAAADSVYSQSIKIDLPYQESFHLDPRKPEALGYRFSIKRGQKVLIEVQQLNQDSSHIFIDAFRVISDSLKQYRQIASADSALNLGFEPREDADYILRLQPELLRGGTFNITIRKVPSLQFPVAGKNSRAIQSVFGDARDGGKREHHGVDIFAKRYTPIIAPCKGYVRFVGKRGIGGNVIWIYDNQRNQSLYFAHLQTQLVSSRTYVNKGDTIGTVGNSGNARTTPPHLHFAIYKNGPIDPFFFLAEMPMDPQPIQTYASVLGGVLATIEGAKVRQENSEESAIIDTLSNASINIKAITSNLLRIQTMDGRIGYLKSEDVLFPTATPY
jgi:murein DD-endopeptidase MepM/ murein hydrolase activator NlpD